MAETTSGIPPGVYFGLIGIGLVLLVLGARSRQRRRNNATGLAASEVNSGQLSQQQQQQQQQHRVIIISSTAPQNDPRPFIHGTSINVDHRGPLTDYELEQIAARHGFQAASEAMDRQEMHEQLERRRRQQGDTVAIAMPQAPPAYSMDVPPPKYEEVVTSPVVQHPETTVPANHTASTDTPTVNPTPRPPNP